VRLGNGVIVAVDVGIAEGVHVGKNTDRVGGTNTVGKTASFLSLAADALPVRT
jgi:hypothetical protein